MFDPTGKMVMRKGVKLDAHINNVAEYVALEVGLQMCIGYGVKRLQIKGDALLIVKQVLGPWQSKNSKLKSFCYKM